MEYISQQFEVEIVKVSEDGTEIPVAPNLSKAVTKWERDFAEDDDDLQVEDGEDEEESEDSYEDEDADPEDFLVNEEEYEGATPDGVLYLTVQLNRAILEEFRELQSSKASYKVRIIYGTPTTGQLVRVFDTDNNANVIFNSGVQTPAGLEVDLAFDIYGADTLLTGG